MRIVTWNCAGALRKKFHAIEEFDADVLVIQECEDPARSESQYRDWAGNFIWVGESKNKGIGIFARKGRSLEALTWKNDGWSLFLPVRIDCRFDILAVWTQAASSFGYIGQFWRYLQENRSALNTRTIICGDFNSNSIWDKPRRSWNHTDCVETLAADGFRSVYHHVMNERQGCESQPTFYLQRKASKPYHIDYIFLHEEQFSITPPQMQIGDPTVWLSLSDHMPLIVEYSG